jgi:hypothetical protein
MLNFDKYGVLCHLRNDGSLECGDGLNWSCHYAYYSGNEIDLDFFESGFGGYVRHPIPSQTDNGFGAYYKSPYLGCISRDQLTGLLAYIIKFKPTGAAFRLFLHYIPRLFLFSYNTIDNGVDPKKAKFKLPDPTLFDIWSMILRTNKILSVLFWPILNILDIHLLINTIAFNSFISKDPISYGIKLISCHENTPTLISLLSIIIVNRSKLDLETSIYWSTWRKNGGMAFLFKNYLNNIKGFSYEVFIYTISFVCIYFFMRQW